MENKTDLQKKNKTSKVKVWHLFDKQVEIDNKSSWVKTAENYACYCYVNSATVVQIECINGVFSMMTFSSKHFDIFDFDPCNKSEVETAFNNALNQFKNLLQ